MEPRKITPEIIEYWMKNFGLEGMGVFNNEEFIHPNGSPLRLERLVILGAYDDSRPSTVFFTDINCDRSKGYLGWRQS
jgi:hypothetical protein